mmetsp:Transcript_121276/g.377046  ORF Transcript_121276/g.377046 Transcript_121276/m.377046 type:complete len:202 (-) Transcript_121276:479-1084(-)
MLRPMMLGATPQLPLLGACEPWPMAVSCIVGPWSAPGSSAVPCCKPWACRDTSSCTHSRSTMQRQSVPWSTPITTEKMTKPWGILALMRKRLWMHTCAMSPTTFSMPTRCDVVRSVTGRATGRGEASGSKGSTSRTAAFTSLKSSMMKPKDEGSSWSQSVQAKHEFRSSCPSTTPKTKVAREAHQSEDPQSLAMKMKATSV